MNLLGYLVPAFREIRAPLAGGYLWVLAVWLNVGDRVPELATLSDGSSPWRQLARFDGMLGSAGLLVVISLAALLVGSIAGEAIGRAVTSFSEGPDALEDLGELVPEAKYSVDRALRIHSEAELRLHVAMPLAAIGISLARADLVVGLIVLAFALVVGAHGSLLVGRWRRRAESARTLATQSSELMSTEEHKAREADIRLTGSLTKTGSGDGKLHVQNSGQHSARQVFLVDPSSDDGAPPEYVVDGFLPIEELKPGDSVAVPIGLSLAHASAQKVIVQWIDGTGEQVAERTIYFS